MTNRERALNILHFKPVDRLPAVHFGYWNELLVAWAEQGNISSDLARAWGGGGCRTGSNKESGFDGRICSMSRSSFDAGYEI